MIVRIAPEHTTGGCFEWRCSPTLKSPDWIEGRGRSEQYLFIRPSRHHCSCFLAITVQCQLTWLASDE